MNKQEMFSRSVVGLRSQGFKRALVNGDPVYNDGNGCHCAWGWVDESILPGQDAYYVAGLQADGIGVAADLTLEGLNFARSLQWCHDDSSTPQAMQRRLKQLGEREGLTWPE